MLLDLDFAAGSGRERTEYPITGMTACGARAASGEVAPPMSVMNSRRRKCPPEYTPCAMAKA